LMQMLPINGVIVIILLRAAIATRAIATLSIL
jgi:hypothetical protein